MRLLYVALLVLASLGSYAKKKPDVKRADAFFAKEAYADAIVEYERLNRRDKAKPHVSMQLAISYDKLGKSVQAAKYYGQAIDANPNVGAEILYAYAQNVLSNGRYEVATGVMKKFVETADPNDPRAVDFVAFQHDLQAVKERPDAYLIEESGLNDLYYDDFGLTKPKGDTIYFVSNRTKYESKFWRSLFEVKDKKTGKPNLDIYQAEYKNRKDPLYNITRIEGKVNKRFNDGIASVDPRGEVLYFASDSYRNRKFRKDKTVKKRGEMKSIYSAIRKGKRWSKIKVLPFCEAGVIYTNPFVSPDGQYLYFSSNREGSVGALDIWRVAILEQGKYGEPEHLGTQVNRGGVEDYAFVSTDNVLYFASDRWGGFGGLDIYQINLNNLNEKAQNLGSPINTAKDDYNFGFFPNQKIGFISSNRIGREDVYRVYPLCKSAVRFTAVNKTTQKPIAKANVVIKDDKESVIYKGTTDNKGQLDYDLDCTKYFRVEVKNQEYVSAEKDFQVDSDAGTQSISIPMQSIKEWKLEEAAKKAAQELKVEENKIVLQDIEFGLNQSDLPASGKKELDKLVLFMNHNPKISIQINAYTDKTGKPKYNMKLSQERAANTAGYLLEQGIAPDRVMYQGFGESKPKVKCEVCTEEQNAQNRRSEFVIIAQ